MADPDHPPMLGDMTPDEARQLLNDTSGWVGWGLWDEGDDTICLDGYFTIKELEALIVLMRLSREPHD